MTSVAETRPGGDPRAEESRQRILAAAEKLIAVRGIEKVRLRDIATEAKVSIGKIQHYFETRDAVVEEMLKTASLRRVAQWATFASDIDDPAAKLISLLEHSVTDRERCTVWLATVSAASRNERFMPDVVRTYDAWRAKFTEEIGLGSDRGTFHPTAPIDQVVDEIICLIDGLMTAAAIDLALYTPQRNAIMLRHVTGLLVGLSLDEQTRS